MRLVFQRVENGLANCVFLVGKCLMDCGVSVGKNLKNYGF